MKQIHVAAAAIFREQHLLLSRRLKHVHQGGKWEFPGGKVEEGESVEDALKRELLEELAISVTEYSPLIRVHHNYPDLSVLLDVWRVDAFDGQPKGYEGQEIRWFEPSVLRDLEFPEANLPIVKAVMLPEQLSVTSHEAFLEGRDYLVWSCEGIPDWSSFRAFTEDAPLPVYLDASHQADITVERVRQFGGQGLILT